MKIGNEKKNNLTKKDFIKIKSFLESAYSCHDGHDDITKEVEKLAKKIGKVIELLEMNEK